MISSITDLTFEQIDKLREDLNNNFFDNSL
jgi:hypothetical protein